jgi:hypothetical protein
MYGIVPPTNNFKIMLMRAIVFLLLIFPLWVLSQTPYQVYYGNLHSHTSQSDGEGTPAIAYQYARDSAGIDFLAVTDHLEQISSSEWSDVQYQADAGTQTGNFVGISGWEYGSPFYGHVNVFNNTQQITTLGWYYLDWGGFTDWLLAHPPGFAQFNHPGDDITANNWNNFEYKGASLDSAIPLIEFQNIQQATDFYELSLLKGWHLSPVWNQDNHSADWGTKNNGRAGLWATELSRPALFDAISGGRTFATMDKNASVWISSNTTPMGSIAARQVDLPVQISLQDGDSEIWTLIEIVSNNGILMSLDSITGNFDTIIYITPYTDNYIFIRGIQADGNYIWSAPLCINGDISGQNDISFPTEIKVFPNPASESICVRNSQPGSVLLIYNIYGGMVYSETFDDNTDIHCDDLLPGIYLVEISNRAGKSYFKQVIKK